MFSAVERTGSYKMWSQVLPGVSRGIYAKVFLAQGKLRIHNFEGSPVPIRCVYCVYLTITTTLSVD